MARTSDRVHKYKHAKQLVKKLKHQHKAGVQPPKDPEFVLQQLSNPLHIACKEGDVQSVKQLGKRKADDSDEHGNIPILLAIVRGHVEVVQALVELQANLHITTNYRGKFTVPLIWIAARLGELAVVKKLLELGANLVDGVEGSTPLHMAAEKGHLEVAQFLLDKGASIDARAVDGRYTSLYLAAEKGQLEMVKLLVRNGADVNALSQESVRTVGTHVVPILSAAATGGHIEVMKYLLENGATVGLVVGDKGNPCAIHAAANSGRIECVKLLLQHGADINRIDSDISVLRRAVSGDVAGENMPMVQFLLDNGADVNSTAPILTAVQEGKMQFLEYLLKRGANVNLPKQYSALLPVAICHKRFDMAKFLIANGANPDDHLRSFDDLGNFSPLHFICSETGHNTTVVYEIGKLLIQAGANVNVLSSWHRYKQIPEDFANENRSYDQNDEDDEHYYFNNVTPLHVTPLHVAIRTKYTDMVWLLSCCGTLDSFKYPSTKGGFSSITVWDWLALQEGPQAETREALLHFWTPATHRKHPKFIRDEIVSTLLVSKRLKWPFDKDIMHNLLSFVAYRPFVQVTNEFDAALSHNPEEELFEEDGN